MSFRRSAVGEWFFAIPTMIRALMIACVAIWLVQLATIRSSAVPWRLFALSPAGLGHGYVWQLVTHQFLHAPDDIAHVFFNMFALWMFGRHLEVRWGGWHFLLFYLTCGIGGGLVFVGLAALIGAYGAVAIGASAAVLGVTMAWAMVWPNQKILLFFVIPMQARHAVLAIALIELLLAWVPGQGLANFAHLAGMGTAWIYLRSAGSFRSFKGSLRRQLDAARWSWRKRHMRAVEKDWEKVLRDEDDGRRH